MGDDLMSSYYCISLLHLVHCSDLGIDPLPKLHDFACIHLLLPYAKMAHALPLLEGLSILGKYLLTGFPNTPGGSITGRRWRNLPASLSRFLPTSFII